MFRKIIEIRCNIFMSNGPTYHIQIIYTKNNFPFVSLYKGDYPTNGDKIICLMNHSKSEELGRLTVLKYLNKVPITRHEFLLLRHL